MRRARGSDRDVHPGYGDENKMRPGGPGRQREGGSRSGFLGAYFHDSGNSDAGLLTSTAPGPPLDGIKVNSLVPFDVPAA